MATDRNVEEYLSCGVNEKEALTCLFTALPAEEASKAYRQCVSDVLKLDDVDGELRDPVIGTWSRLVLLGNRITDKNTFEDVDENLRRSVVSSISGTLCAPSCFNDASSVAVILCLARRILISENEMKKNERPQALERYHDWFRDLISRSDTVLVKALLTPLTQLLPLESLHFLKLNHRVFSANRSHFRVASEYVALVRARIRDFDPAFSRLGEGDGTTMVGSSNGGTQVGEKSNGKFSQKLMNEVVGFVSSYVKEKGKLPATLTRQMNFHRYHFRRFTLPVLLHADFVVLRPEDGDVKLMMASESFDERRIEIINELAFKRKDQAITKTEAKEAIKAINAATKRRELEKRKDKVEQKHNLASSRVGESSDLGAMILAILKDEAEHGFNATQICKDGAQVKQAKDFLLSNIVQMVSKCKGNHDELASASLNILESLCLSMECVQREKDDLPMSSLLSPSPPEEWKMMQQYSAWWRSSGRSLIWLVSHVLGDSRVVSIHGHMQYQLISLICLKAVSLSRRKLLALAMIVAVLVALQGREAVSDLCFMSLGSTPIRLRHVAFVIFDYLPLKGEYIVTSTFFVVECMLLLKAFTSSDLLAIDGEAGGNALSSSDFEHCEGKVMAFGQPLLSMVRWVVSNPWRMNIIAKKITQGDEQGQARILLNSRNVFLKAVCALRELATSSSSDTLLIDALSLELRCGSGKKQAIVEFLRGLESSGMHTLQIIHVIVMFLAKEAEEGDDRKSDWIMSGLLTFHDESQMDRNHYEERSAAFQVEQSRQRYGCGVSFRLIEYYHQMEFNYFRGCEDVDKHVSQVLVNVFWPLPKRLVTYILCCLKWTSSHKDHTITNAFFIANCVLVSDNHLADDRDSKLVKGKKENGRKHVGRASLDQNIDEISSVLHYFISTSSTSTVMGDGDGRSYTQGIIDHVNESIIFEHAFVLGIAIGMYFGRIRLSNLDSVSSEVRQVITSIAIKVGNASCCDILDCSIIACSMLPFGYVENEFSDREECASRTDLALKSMITERIVLCEGGQQQNPFWTKELLVDRWLKKGGQEDVRQIFSCWDDESAYRCLGRVFSVVGMVDEAYLGRFVTCIGHETVLRVVLPNMIWAYSIVRNVEGTFGESLVEGVIRAVGRLSVHLEERVDGGVVSSLAGRFGDTGATIMCLLQSGAYG